MSRSPAATHSRRALIAAAISMSLAAPPALTRAAQSPRQPDAAAAPPGTPQAGGTVTVGSMLEPDTLHPWEGGNLASADILAGVCEGLFRVNAAGRLQPALAERVELSADGLTYTFALREGVTYHDGSAFTGDDVLAAWDARLDGAWAPAASLGWERVADMSLDGSTLTVRTTEPYAPFLSTVALTPIVPAAALADGPDAFRERYRAAPVGTGPFQVEEWTPGKHVRLRRFDGYWAGAPLLERIEWRAVPDIETLLTGLGSGELDASPGAGGVPPASVERALALPDVTTWEIDTPNWQHLDLKQVGFLRETAVRQALDFATPRDRIVDTLLAGRAAPAFADQVPGGWAFADDLAPRPFDPAKAAELLAGAGLKPGRDGVLVRDGVPFRIELWGVAGDPLAEAILREIGQEWANLGIAALVRTAEAGPLWGPMGYQFTDRMTACLYTWTNGVDPDDLFYWHSSQIPTAPTAPGGNVQAFFHEYAFQDRIDDLTARGASTLDAAQRADIYREIQALLREEAPAIFLYWEQAFPASRADIGGIWPGSSCGLLWNAASWYRAVPGTPAPAATPAPMATPVGIDFGA